MGNEEEEEVVKKMVVVEEKYCYEEETELTVHKTSTFSQGDGFSVYDSNGVIIFRVDSFGSFNHPLLLMDPFGKPLLTLLPKRLTLHQRWEGYKGEKIDGQQQEPIFKVKKSTIIGRSSVTVRVHHSGSTYQIEGSYGERNCIIYHMSSTPSDHDTPKVSMAEMKRKVEPTRNIMLGRDVFSLNLKAGFDAAFAIGVVMALDRIDGDDAFPIEFRKDIHA